MSETPADAQEISDQLLDMKSRSALASMLGTSMNDAAALAAASAELKSIAARSAPRAVTNGDMAFELARRDGRQLPTITAENVQQVQNEIYGEYLQTHGPLIQQIRDALAVAAATIPEDIELAKKIYAWKVDEYRNHGATAPSGLPYSPEVRDVMVRSYMEVRSRHLANTPVEEIAQLELVSYFEQVAPSGHTFGLDTHPSVVLAAQTLKQNPLPGLDGKPVRPAKPPAPGLSGPWVGLPIDPPPDMQPLRVSTKHIGGHRALPVEGRPIPTMIQSTGISFYRNSRDIDSIAVVEFGKVKRITVEGPDTIQSRVTVPRLAAVGIFGLAAKKQMKTSHLILEPHEGPTVILQIDKHTSWELRGALAPVLHMFGS